ncbi:DUF3164 family protein [Eikenella sp. NML03-A-027]|uniref:DUF3164 family protein n=1 Tax=Eikenella sp. NML03-A-027 TaxID=1795828 RepID=UPI000AD7FBF7|nr:DUF3164 family protein [Eikenella sp. NML03-A-027]
MSQIDMSQYKKDARGNLVPIDNIREIDLLRDELVMEIVGKAQAVAEQLADYKRGAMDDINAFVQLSAERFGVELGGKKKGNLTLHSFDGHYRVQYAVQDTLSFDEGLQAAKALIDEALHDMLAGVTDADVWTIVQAAFATDKEGNISTGKVLGLRRLKISHPKWQQAMDAVADSLQILTSKAYVRVYRRDDEGDYKLMNLDIAKV